MVECVAVCHANLLGKEWRECDKLCCSVIQILCLQENTVKINENEIKYLCLKCLINCEIN